MKRLIPIALLAVSLCAPGLLFSQVPGEISYQGLLTGVTGTVDLTLRLYGTEVGGTVLWTENHPAVELVGEGVFSIILGTTQPFSGLTFDRPYWLEVAVNGTILTPRTKFITSPYAFRAQTANGVADGSIEPDDIKVSGGAPQNNQALTFNGATGQFRWATVGGGGGGGAIDELVEGEGIRIDGLTGPSSIISIAEDGVTTDMLADGAVTSEKIANATIVAANIADGAITQDKFAPEVGLPSVGTAGGDLQGNFPNPTIAANVIGATQLKTNAVTTAKIENDAITSDKIADGAVNSEHVNANANLTITSIRLSDSVGSQKLNVKARATFEGTVGMGSAPIAGKRLVVNPIGATNNTHSIDVPNAGGGSHFTVRDDGNVGVGTNAPGAALEIRRAAGPGLHVSSGSTSFSFAAVAAGPAIAIPASTTVVNITSDAVPGSPNALVFPAATNPGEFMIITNGDNDPTTGAAIIAAGQAGIFVFLPAPVNAWRRVN